MENEGTTLANLEFDYKFAGRDFKLKKASLKQVIEWQNKVMEINSSKSASADLLAVAQALYISIHSTDSTITEDYILENAPGDIDVVSTLVQLGFMSQKKVEKLPQKNSLASETIQPSGEKSILQ